jgi:Holliday junction resolvasome RuvABC DNA-binding subunit
MGSTGTGSSGGRGGGGSSASLPAGVSEASISTLMRMGFSREQVIQALTVCGGNADMAASFLFSQQGAMFD